MLWDEANLALERVNHEEIIRANLILLAISANLGKDGKKAFDTQLKSLSFETRPYED